MPSTPIKASLALAALFLVSAPALALADEAPPPAHFGDSGQFALHLSEGLSASYGDIISGPEIQADYFVAPHVSLGLMAGANWYSGSAISGSSSSSNFVFRAGPRLGYDIPLTDYVSWWPQIGVDYRSESTGSSTLSTGGTTVTVANTNTTSAFAFTAVAPILIHPTRGFFIGAGPAFYTEISNSTSSGGASFDNPKVTSVGLMATIGGAI